MHLLHVFKYPVSLKKKKKVFLYSVLCKGISHFVMLSCGRMLRCTVAFVNLALLFDRTTSTPYSLSTTTGTCFSACTRSCVSACTRSTPTLSKSPPRRRSVARTGRSPPPSLFASKLPVSPS